MATSVSSVTKHFPSAENGFTTTLASTISSGATTVPLNSVAGYANGEVVVFIVDPSDAAKKQTFTGTVDTAGVQITDVVWTSGTNQTHTAGSTVVDYVDAAHISMVSKGVLVHANQDGTMKTSLPLTTPQITTSINDSNGNEVIKTPATSSAVNEITVTNAATGNAPKVSATGGDTNINLNLQGKGTGSVQINGTDILQGQDYFVSGCVWSADAVGSTRVASMTAGVVCIGGNFLTVAAVTSRTFTASKDVYVDFNDNGDGTAVPVYYDNTTNAASPTFATTTGTIRNAIIVVGASSIATTASINQGNVTGVLPATSGFYVGAFDTNAYPINPRSPIKRLVGSQARQDSPTTGAPGGTAVAWNGCSYIPFIAEANTNYRLSFEVSIMSGYSGSGRFIIIAYLGTSANAYTTQVQEYTDYLNSAGHGVSFSLDFNSGTYSGLTYLSLKLDSTGWSGTNTINGSAQRPAVYTITKIG